MGTRLHQLRRAAGLTRRKLSGATGISQQHIYRLERGLRRTRRRTLGVLTEAMGCPEEADELAALAGPALAAESGWLERIEKRRLRRVRRRRVLKEREDYRIQRATLEAEWEHRTRSHLELRAMIRALTLSVDLWSREGSHYRRPRGRRPRLF